MYNPDQGWLLAEAREAKGIYQEGGSVEGLLTATPSWGQADLSSLLQLLLLSWLH